MNKEQLTLLSIKDILSIPRDLYPMLVLSDNLRSLFSWAIKEHEQGGYNHAMWLIAPGMLASQNLVFQKQKIYDYTSSCRLKLWHCPEWTSKRARIMQGIKQDLKRPFYKRLYDPLAIIGQLLHLDFIQTPGLDICSDKAKYLKLADPEYDLTHPDPENVNRWLETHSLYQVYGRYVPD